MSNQLLHLLWVCTSDQYGKKELVGVFSSRELADRAQAFLKNDYQNWIQDLRVDSAKKEWFDV